MFCWKSKDQIVWVYSGFPILFHSSICQSVCWYFCCLVAKSCLILCDPIAASHQASLSITNSQSLLKLMSLKSVMPSNHLIFCHPLLLLPSIFPSIGVFPMNQFFPSGNQSFGASASATVLPMNTQDWSPLGWTGWILLQSKGLSRAFSNTTVQKHQFFGAQLSLCPVHFLPIKRLNCGL